MAKTRTAKKPTRTPRRPRARSAEETVIEVVEDMRFHADRHADSIDAQLAEIKRLVKGVAADVRKLKG